MDRIQRTLIAATPEGRAYLDRLDAEKAKAKRARTARRSSRSPRAPDAKPTKAQRKLTKAMLDRIEYEAVVRRDRGCTTVLGLQIVPCSGLLTIDHQWGRGKAPTKRENCRRLCEGHHRLKTDSNPSRVLWLMDFEMWAEGHGYQAEADKAVALRILEEAQHPARREGETTP